MFLLSFSLKAALWSTQEHAGSRRAGAEADAPENGPFVPLGLRYRAERTMAAKPTAAEPAPLRVSLVALPDAVISTLAGLFDVMNGVALVGASFVGLRPPFKTEIVGETKGPLELVSGLPIEVMRAVSDVRTTDIVIVPSIILPKKGWQPGRYPELVRWLARMHEKGALLCSACSGLFLLAETGLFSGKDATVHFG
jgi:transcriptional regulator GlxA family with amidase domain